MTYWVGMTPQICGNSSTSYLTATDQLQVKRRANLTLGVRTFNSVIESCYWIIQAENGIWQEGAQIYIYLDFSTTANMFVY
jgi:hypothetical protein